MPLYCLQSCPLSNSHCGRGLARLELGREVVWGQQEQWRLRDVSACLALLPIPMPCRLFDGQASIQACRLPAPCAVRVFVCLARSLSPPLYHISRKNFTI